MFIFDLKKKIQSLTMNHQFCQDFVDDEVVKIDIANALDNWCTLVEMEAKQHASILQNLETRCKENKQMAISLQKQVAEILEMIEILCTEKRH